MTGAHSTKRTFHISLDIPNTPFPFNAGDSIGVFPENDPAEVAAILDCLGDGSVFDARAQNTLPFSQFLREKANLAKGNLALLKRLVEKGASIDLEKKNALLESHTLLELLRFAPLTPQEVADVALPLLPRFYSIASSVKTHPDEIHLLVAYLEYEQNGKTRRGVGSHFLCELAEVGTTPIAIYPQPSPHFTLPEPTAPIILIGPGTGVAPFRAFLQERLATNAPGKNWLFFGERNRESDFYYADFLLALEKEGKLKLDLAFSRDQAEKIYVQHKMYQERKRLWEWLEEGAYLYICGDAEKMAKEVEATLLQIIKEAKGSSLEEARLYLKKLRSEKRYLTDVY